MILSFSLYAQSYNDILVYKTGSRSEGKFVKMNRKLIFFQFKGQDTPWEIKKSTIDSLISGNLDGKSYFIDLKSGELKLTEYGKKFAAEKEAEELRVEMERRSKINYLILPFKNDKYARTEQYNKFVQDEGFNIISNYYALEYFSKNKILLNEINDYEIIKMAEALNIDMVVFGDLYTIKEDFIYAPDLKAAADYQISQQSQQVGQFAPLGSDMNRQALLRNASNIWSDASALSNISSDNKNKLSAEQKAGTYLYETSYLINVAKKQRTYIQKNEIVKKW